MFDTIMTSPGSELQKMERAGRLIGKLKLNVDDPELRARAAWNVAAGKKIAEHTRAVALVRGSLVVEVEDQIWQRQLKTLSGFLVRNLEKALGEILVTDIDFRPMPKRREPQRAERARGSEDVEDPVLDMLYRQARKKG
jgi:predicted nucleic acid-binding Zn ribbon protein